MANYPWDNVKYYSGYSSVYSATTDDDVFRSLALNYSFNHANMRKSICGYDNFPNGITNGGDNKEILIFVDVD